MTYIHVKVTAGAGKESFAKKKNSEDHFEVSVREKAERNMANGRVTELVAAHFGVPANKVRIVNGHKHPSKLLIIE